MTNLSFADLWEKTIRDTAAHFGVEVDEAALAETRALLTEPVDMSRGIVVARYAYDADPRAAFSGFDPGD